MLAHDSFAGQVDAWLRKPVIAYKPLLISFHLPSSKVREVRLPSCKDFLRSIQAWDEFVRLHGRAKLPCPCEKYRDKFSDFCLVQGHVIAGVELLAAIHPLLEYLGQGSANSSFFPSKTRLTEMLFSGFHAWRKKHGLPVVADSTSCSSWKSSGQRAVILFILEEG